MNFKKIEISEITKLSNEDLIAVCKESKIWLAEECGRIEDKTLASELIKKIIKFEDEVKKRNIPLSEKHYCECCKKFWNIDEYCPHGFDSDKLQSLKARSIKISVVDETIIFYDKDNKIIGENII